MPSRWTDYAMDVAAGVLILALVVLLAVMGWKCGLR